MAETDLLEPFEDEFTNQVGIKASILRLDKIHPIVSGNKIFKLKYYLESALNNRQETIITFGGPYSNHLHATAYACRQAGITTIGVLRGPEPPILSPTLQDCLSFGMQLKWLDSQLCDEHLSAYLSEQYPDALYIPQGGMGDLGVLGAATIMELPGLRHTDTLLAACGTGTMGAGLILGKQGHQRLLLISVLKNNFSVVNDLCRLTGQETLDRMNTSIQFDFHMGGYARKSATLFGGMNSFWERTRIPTDFVYTGKMVAAFYEMLASGKFEKGEQVTIIHSGGLQGNRSLTNGELLF
jgi:1-aminocyclopropane-1-carboxylate deaminase